VPKCNANGCGKDADFEVILFDVYSEGEVFFEQDQTCPHLCENHVIENELKADGDRKPRGVTSYPHSNRHRAQGYSMYRPLNAK
jgi:hypothetical protein